MKKLLHNNYPWLYTPIFGNTLAIVVAIYTFWFTYIMKPFNLDGFIHPNHYLLACATFSTIIGVVILYYSFLNPIIFKKIHKRWTVRKEIAMLICSTFTSSLLCSLSLEFFFSNVDYFRWNALYHFVFQNVIGATIPITGLVLTNNIRILKKRQQDLLLWNQQNDSMKNKIEKNNDELNINNFAIKPYDLVLVSSSGNYIELTCSHIKNKNIQRMTLQQFEDAIKFFPIFIKVHRSHIININFIESFDGTVSQGYDLKLKGTDEIIKVSRSYSRQFLERLEFINLESA